MRELLTITALTLFCTISYGQNPAFDRLELNYAQRHYRKVYKQANRMLDKPDYDFSQLPKYYKSISLFQLCQNDHWRELHPNALSYAKDLLVEVRDSEDGEKIFNSHMYELTWLKGDMETWAGDLKRSGQTSTFKEVQAIIESIFGDVPDVDSGNDANHVTDSTLPDKDTTTQTPIVESSEVKGERNKIVATAKEQLGVPYVWAGSSPDGFDCSGFTSYVMKKHGMDLPRRAGDQYESSTKLKAKDAKKGDLVFFNNGSGISHVGIVISDKGEPLVMIHSASSTGIIITEVEKSEYWMKRLHGYGTYVN